MRSRTCSLKPTPSNGAASNLHLLAIDVALRLRSHNVNALDGRACRRGSRDPTINRSSRSSHDLHRQPSVRTCRRIGMCRRIGGLGTHLQPSDRHRIHPCIHRQQRRTIARRRIVRHPR